MVMHARKYPRFNDGYHDRNQAHPYEDKYPSKSHGSNYNDRYSDKSKDSSNFNRSRDESPGSRPSPRYANKSSYIERNKEKDRLDKGVGSSPADRRINHYPSSTQSTSNVSDNSDRHSFQDNKLLKEAKEQREREQKEKDHRMEIRKSAIQVWKDWSEHLSSSGKRYYYNCKTEVSQWEKPKDWVDQSTSLSSGNDYRGRDKNGRDSRAAVQSSTFSTKSSDDRYKHSISNERPLERSYGKVSAACSSASSSTSQSRGYMDRMPSHGAGGIPTPSSSTLASAIAEIRHRQSSLSSSQQSGDINHTHHHRHGLSQQKAWHGPADYSRGDSHRRDMPNLGPRTSSEGGRSQDRYAGRREDYGISGTKSSAALGSAMATHNGARAGEYRTEHEDSREAEDMEISPGSTPTSSRPNSQTGTPYMASGSTPGSMTTHTSTMSHPKSSSVLGAVAALPQLISHISDRNTHGMGNQDFTQQAIQTLQKLQQALIANQQQQMLQQLQQHQKQNAASYPGHSPRMSVEATPPRHPLQSPQRNSHSRPVEDHHNQTGEESLSPQSDHSVRSSRHEGSPSPSHNSSQSVSLSRGLNAVGSRKQDSIQLTASLSNYYNERLVQHVTGWQGDQAERQANRYTEEAYTVGNLLCTQVSADLKKARSLVRISEIQSTLQEQRILFLRQQIKELENLRSQNTYYSDNT